MFFPLNHCYCLKCYYLPPLYTPGQTWQIDVIYSPVMSVKIIKLLNWSFWLKRKSKLMWAAVGTSRLIENRQFWSIGQCSLLFVFCRYSFSHKTLYVVEVILINSRERETTLITTHYIFIWIGLVFSKWLSSTMQTMSVVRYSRTQGFTDLRKGSVYLILSYKYLYFFWQCNETMCSFFISILWTLLIMLFNVYEYLF